MMKWIEFTPETMPTEEKYYHTKGENMVTYWHNDEKYWDKYAVVTHYLSESPASDEQEQDELWEELKQDVEGIELTEKYLKKMKSKWGINKTQ